MSQFENLKMKEDHVKVQEFSNQSIFKFSNLDNFKR
jgi:hypothetical protein